eukprot:1156476-Pelagomonas_calceolata.AAC.9
MKGQQIARAEVHSTKGWHAALHTPWRAGKQTRHAVPAKSAGAHGKMEGTRPEVGEGKLKSFPLHE